MQMYYIIIYRNNNDEMTIDSRHIVSSCIGMLIYFWKITLVKSFHQLETLTL